MSSAARAAPFGLLAALIVVHAVACGNRPEQGRAEVAPEHAQPQIAPTKRSLAPADANIMQQSTPAALLETIHARMRLTPDRRFIAALPRIDRLSGASPTAALMVSFDAGHWRVRLGSEEVGTLPELPAFPDQYALVLARAAQNWKQHGVVLPAPTIAADDANFGGEPLATLRAIDQRWAKGERNADSAIAAARAYIVLCAQMVDKLDVADTLFAQALAATAFAEVVSGRDPVREKALLASIMGYDGSASPIASALPEGDVMRAYVERDVDAAVAAAKAHKDDLLTAQLALRTLRARAQTRDVEAFIEQEPDAFKGSFPALSARIDGSWRTGAELRMVFSALLAMREANGQTSELPAEARYASGGLRENADVAMVAHALQLPFEQVLPQGERLLAAIAAGPDGAWLPADARNTYYKAQFFSALDALVEFYVDHLNSPDQAKEIVATLGSGEGAIAQQFERFAKDIIRAEQRTLPLDALVKDIRELKMLGIGALDRMWEPIRKQGAYSSVQSHAASAIVERCDSRLSCRNLLSDIAYYSLNDLVSDEALRRSVVAESPYRYEGLRLRHLRMEGDHAAFLARLRDGTASPSLRVWYLSDRPEWLKPDEVRGAFDALVHEAPTDFKVREDYAAWLIEQKDFKRAIAVLDEWLAQKKTDHVLNPILAHTMRARALQLSGHVREAWKEIEPLLPSMYGPTMMRAAYIKAAAGEPEQAIALARARLQRYSDPNSVALVAEMLWRAGETKQAAELIENWSNRLTIVEWANEIADAFANAYRDKPDQGAAAYTDLLATKVDRQGVREMIRTSKMPAELAFRAASQLKGGGYLRHWDVARAYQMLKAWKGEAEAHAWIEKALPTDRDPISQHGYSAGAYELIWNFVEDPKPGPDAAFTWLMRTAAYLNSPSPGADWKARLDQYYAQHRDDFRDRMGLHLLGEADQPSVWAAAKNEHDRPESTWVFGLKAQLDGDIAQAVDWYRVTMEGGRANSGEVQWASNALESLRDQGKSLALLSSEAKAKTQAAPSN